MSTLTMTLCSQCSSMAHFACIDHCRDVFCGKCSVKHRTAVRNRMSELNEELRLCRIDPVTTQDQIDANFRRASQQTLQRARDSVKNLINELQQREQSIENEIEKSLQRRQDERMKRTDASLLTSEEAVDYQHILDDSLKTDKLVESTALNTIQKRLDARKALGKSASEAQPIIFELGNIDVQKVLFIRSAARLETKEKKFRGNRSVSVTVGLGRQKRFEIPLEKTFSIGAHPTAVSLNDRYLETFFCRRTPGNSLILLSSTSIDIVNRGSGLESSVRLSKILGTTKDKILAGNWCESSQRLYLVGNHRMYIYDFQSDEHAKQYLCEPINGDSKNTQRFICSGQNGSIFYAFKSGDEMYTIEKFNRPTLNGKENYDRNHFLHPVAKLTVHGQIGGMCSTHNRLAVVYRMFIKDQLKGHLIHFYGHQLNSISTNGQQLESDIRWVTSICSFGNDDRFLLCDPRGQQLVLYSYENGLYNRRFRIGAINACCLTDGKLVLWLQKQYPTSPTGKLHFISSPHLEEFAKVAKSHPLLGNK